VAIINRWKEWSSGDLERIEKRKIAGDLEVASRVEVVLREIAFRKLVPEPVWKVEPRVAEIVLHGSGDDVAELVVRLSERAKGGPFPTRSIVAVLIELIGDDRPTRHGSLDSDRPFKGGESKPRFERKVELGEYVLPILCSIAYKPQFKTRDSWQRWWAENRDKPEKDWYLPDLDHDDEAQRVVVIARLAALDDSTLYPRLFQSLESFLDDEEICNAIQALSPIPSKVLVPHLKPYLVDRRPYVRLAAAKRLVTELPRESIDAVVASIEKPEMMEFYGSDREFFLDGVGIVDWLASTQDERAYAFLFRALKSGSLNRKINILEAIHEQPFPGVEEAILGAFDDSAVWPTGGFRGAEIRSPRVADMAGIFLARRLHMNEEFVWTGPVEERDRNLAKIRERWKRGK